MARLFLRDDARADPSEAFPWYEARRPGLGYEFLRAARVTPAAVERDPEQYPFAIDDIRKARLRRSPFVVYYVVPDGGVSVIAVMHGRRHPHRWQARR